MWVNFDPPLAVRIHFQKPLVWVITGKALLALFLLNFIITVWKNQKKKKSQRVRAQSSPLALHSSATISASIYSVAALPAIVCQEKPDLSAVLWSPDSLVQPRNSTETRKTHTSRPHTHARKHSELSCLSASHRHPEYCSANKELSQVDKNWRLTTQESQRRPAILHQERSCRPGGFPPDWGELLAPDAANKRRRQTPRRKRFIAAPHQLQAANSADYRFKLQAPLGIPALRVCSNSTDSFLSPTPKSGSQETIRTS